MSIYVSALPRRVPNLQATYLESRLQCTAFGASQRVKRLIAYRGEHESCPMRLMHLAEDIGAFHYLG